MRWCESITSPPVMWRGEGEFPASPTVRHAPLASLLRVFFVSIALHTLAHTNAHGVCGGRAPSNRRLPGPHEIWIAVAGGEKSRSEIPVRQQKPISFGPLAAESHGWKRPSRAYGTLLSCGEKTA